MQTKLSLDCFPLANFLHVEWLDYIKIKTYATQDRLLGVCDIVIICIVLCVKETFYPFLKQVLDFTCLQNESFEKKEGTGEIAHNEQFLLFARWFLPVWIVSAERVF